MPRPLPGHMALKDFRTRKQVAANELLRKAYLYLYRNTTVDPKIRTQAMLKLNAFTKDTRPTSVKNRCTETGRGGGVLSEFGLCRHRFKLAAEKGDIPGVSRAAW
ncbi:hypothetical protein MVLG_05260 [Microbotryum lychnidis-dioicae p1A1 Lamole]|uniref:30S ribosomal protein S14 n=2 Tax=Microbotryum TaxID=34416 RepID=U5HDQ2_USTV1|nr:hypothetical protein MVLG_05260 [Microbotryum lychnidis-dioicae p1A1 Lamole]SCZ97008.1 BZ3500_MvSof-1268-A1-R1_Chr4-2g06927 [Microbotryum saponariae]SDA06592.1 BZ3501_MvSof-1269-A2-R1_Chr4-2g06638 [Microbotryum saponariae]|eukprot:KDE04305.1 hypothetical protein MVLG_05260 [Microbotryum lychnidis-dioicae p1A1 Lamole]